MNIYLHRIVIFLKFGIVAFRIYKNNGLSLFYDHIIPIAKGVQTWDRMSNFFVRIAIVKKMLQFK